MKASSGPFKAKHPGGRCAVCKNRIAKGTLIVRLEKPVTWISQTRLMRNSGGKLLKDYNSSQYAHADCLEEQ